MTSLKEQFVSHHNGTTMSEIVIMASGPPLLTVLNLLFSQIIALKFPVEIIIRCVGMVMLQSEVSFRVMKPLVIPLLLCGILLLGRKWRQNPPSVLNSKKLWCISEYRSAMLWGTVVAILAVDFQVFPRRFAKTEISGMSLMDLGVGSFVFAAGVVSPVARNVQQERNAVNTIGKSYLSNFDWKLFVLGMIRFVTVWLFSYQSHVSEYGVHWNFFLTLFLLPIVPDTSLLHPRSLQSIIFSPWSLLFVHNCVMLYMMDGVNYTLYAPRTNFFNQNREGILSLLGYICIYKFGVSTGTHIFRANADRQNRSTKLWNSFTTLFLLSIPMLSFCELANRYMDFSANGSEPSLSSLLVPSRRVCNFGYVLLTVGYNLFLISIYGFIQCCIDHTPAATTSGTQPAVTRQTELTLLEATDRNGFFLFLFSNICTGLVNVIMGERTLTSSQGTGFCIVCLYTIFVAIVLSNLPRKLL